MTISLTIPLTEEQAALHGWTLLLVLPMTEEELRFLGAATVSQAEFIAAHRAELAAHVMAAETAGKLDAAGLRELRDLLDRLTDLAASSVMVRDILRRRMVFASGTNGTIIGPWGRA